MQEMMHKNLLLYLDNYPNPFQHWSKVLNSTDLFAFYV